MQYEVAPWSFEDSKVIGESMYFRHKVTTYQLPDAMPVMGSSQAITIDVFYCVAGRPMLLVHPVLGSKHNEFAITLARFYCLLGWNAVVVHRSHDPMEGKTPEEFELLLRNIIYKDMQVEQFLRHKKWLDPKRTISFGASLGAITNTLLSSQLSYKGYICMLGGGPIASIMARSQDRSIVQWREEKMRERGYRDADELEQEYLRVIETDTLKLANRKANVLLFNAVFDRIVPPATQWQLNRAFGWRKPAFWFPTGHSSILLFLPIILPIMLLWSWYTVYLKR